MLSLGFAGNAIQLVPDGTILVHLVLIVLMVVLLNATLLKPVSRILIERERRIKGRFGDARAILSKVEEKSRECEQMLRDARAEGYARIEEDRAILAKEKERKVAQTKLEMSLILSQEKQRLGVEAEEAKTELAERAQATAQAIVRRVLHRQINEGRSLS